MPAVKFFHLASCTNFSSALPYSDNVSAAVLSAVVFQQVAQAVRLAVDLSKSQQNLISWEVSFIGQSFVLISLR